MERMQRAMLCGVQPDSIVEAEPEIVGFRFDPLPGMD